MRTATGRIISAYKEYLLDVAFQKHVAAKAFPDFEVNSYLMCLDKSQPCTVDGLNQRFRPEVESNGRTRVLYNPGDKNAEVCKKILKHIPVDEYYDQLFEQCREDFHNGNFVEHVERLAGHYERNEKVHPTLGKKCQNCEFRISNLKEEQGLNDGFRECWSEVLDWTDEDFGEQLVYELYAFRNADAHIQKGQVRIRDLADDDVGNESDGQPGLSQQERRYLHFQYVKDASEDSYIDRPGLLDEIANWTFPLHFIDFETLTPAVPLHEGLKPYQSIAFQFSHHTVQEDGTVTHINEYLNDAPGTFPNFDFLRNLKSSLENDEGTIFRYAAHENTILNHIITQLETLGEEESDQ